MDDVLSFGAWLRRRRKALDLKQSELASQVGCATVTIKKFEADERRPSDEMAVRLAACLAVSPAERPRFLKAARGEAGVFRLVHPDVSAPQLTPLPHAVTSSVPTPPTQLVGRDDDLARIAALLAGSRARLVTLVGPPGVGKTHLALEAAARVSRDSGQSAWFVPLAPLGDAQTVTSAIAAQFRVAERPDAPLLAQISAELRGQSALLLLDNFEHVLDAAPLVAELLSACPQLRVLTTSREPLQLRGEHVYQVAPLDPPAAAELFVHRATAARSTFEATKAHGATIAAICQRLDRLPLAIELAAARVTVLSPTELLQQLQRAANRSPLQQRGGKRDAPVHHWTLRETVAWSYNTLSPAQQALFAQLGVFAGGCTLDAIERICEPQDCSLIDDLASLAAKSLLLRIDAPDGASRFTMLQILREFAQEQGYERGEFPALQRRHAEYYLATVTRPGSAYRQPSPAWLDRVAADLDNLRSALEWSTVHDPALALWLAAALGPFWTPRGHVSEGQRWLENTLALAQPASPARTATLYWLGRLLYHQSNLVRAHAIFQQCLELCEATGDRQGAAWALHDLGRSQSDHDKARQFFSRSIELFRALDDHLGAAAAIDELGALERWQGNYSRACTLHEESLAIYRAHDDLVGVADTLHTLGLALMARGDSAGASAAYGEAVAIARMIDHQQSLAWNLLNLGVVESNDGDQMTPLGRFAESATIFEMLGEKAGLAWTCYNRGRAAFRAGDMQQARASLSEGVARFRVLGDPFGTAWTLTVLAEVELLAGAPALCRRYLAESAALLQQIGGAGGFPPLLEVQAQLVARAGQAEQATQMCALADQLRRRQHASHYPADRAAHEQFIQSLRDALGEKAFRAAWALGEELTLEAVLGLTAARA